MKINWEKPVLIFYKQRLDKPETEAFATVKARKLSISQFKGETANLKGTIEDFFPLMGDIDYLSTSAGMSDKYVICWFDDREDDFSKSWRRLNGVVFPDGITCLTNNKGKKICNATFKAEHGKLE
ncbi:MAG: hypothetical protein PVH12_06230 [Candidatus Bathyarchaeota archaeon]